MINDCKRLYRIKQIYTQNFVIVRHGVLEQTLTINSGRELEVIGKPWI